MLKYGWSGPMRISMRTDYGVRAVVELAQHYGKGPVQSKDIALRQGIPEAYLDQLLAVLRKAGLVYSTRGPQGGHVLARPPAEMTLGQVVAALEGTQAPVACLEPAHSCFLVPECAQREVWAQLQELTWRLLEATTIEEMARRQALGRPEARYFI